MTRLLSIVAIFIALPVGAASPPYLVSITSNQCKQGLYRQPGGGPFSVFVFCDDALGVNIGVINTQAAAGPGRIVLDSPKEWSKWQVDDRLWQKSPWASDITSFAWSPDLKALYVATSYVYGTGALYKLDLVNRTFAAVIPESKPNQPTGHFTTITRLDLKTGQVTVKITAVDESGNEKQVRSVKVK